jgi:hypothetical protein
MSNKPRFEEQLLAVAEEKVNKKASFFDIENNITDYDVHCRDEGASSCTIMYTCYKGVPRYMVILSPVNKAIIVDDIDIAAQIAKLYIDPFVYVDAI